MVSEETQMICRLSLVASCLIVAMIVGIPLADFPLGLAAGSESFEVVVPRSDVSKQAALAKSGQFQLAEAELASDTNANDIDNESSPDESSQDESSQDPETPDREDPAGDGVKEESDKKADQEDAEYYELLRLFADTLDQVERNYVKPLDRRELMEAAIRGLLAELDPYSSYIPPDDLNHFQTNIDAQFGGIGIQVSVEGGSLRVISPLVGTPAYNAGLMAGDVITEIEGISTEGITLDGAVQQIKGEIGTNVTLTVRHVHSGQEETLSIRREIIQIETVMGDRRKEDDTWEFMLDDQRKIGYVRLTAFSRTTASDLRQSLEYLVKNECRGLVLDLRFNPGGLLNSAVDVCDLFLADGEIVSTAGRNIRDRSWKAHSAGTFEEMKLAILVNRYSASASEIVSACLQDHKRAVIVGERTWGKGSVQNVIELERGRSALKLTTASYRRPNGENIHRFPGSKETDQWGVSPDDGFEVRLNPSETSEFLIYRRERDILVGRSQGVRPLDEEPQSDPTPVESNSDAENDDGDSVDNEPTNDKSENSESPPEPDQADDKDSDSQNEDSAGQQQDDSSSSSSAEQESNQDSQDGSSEEESKSATTFVDRQLQRALEYLSSQLEQ